jgi:hypothetical protein
VKHFLTLAFVLFAAMAGAAVERERGATDAVVLEHFLHDLVMFPGIIYLHGYVFRSRDARRRGKPA